MILAEPYLKSGKLRALAVLESKREPRLPDVPSVVELGHPDLVMSTWFGLAMPHGTPPAIVSRVNAEVTKVLQAPDIVERLHAMGIDPAKTESADAFGTFMKEDVARWKKVVKEAGIELD
jgi:tripartite-type tricarboxylate transporter receptor subunit TctC